MGPKIGAPGERLQTEPCPRKNLPIPDFQITADDKPRRYITEEYTYLALRMLRLELYTGRFSSKENEKCHRKTYNLRQQTSPNLGTNQKI